VCPTSPIQNESNSWQTTKIEDLLPKDHLLRDIDRAIDFDFIYEEVKDLYSDDFGHLSVAL